MTLKRTDFAGWLTTLKIDPVCSGECIEFLPKREDGFVQPATSSLRPVRCLPVPPSIPLYSLTWVCGSGTFQASLPWQHRLVRYLKRLIGRWFFWTTSRLFLWRHSCDRQVAWVYVRSSWRLRWMAPSSDRHQLLRRISHLTSALVIQGISHFSGKPNILMEITEACKIMFLNAWTRLKAQFCLFIFIFENVD